MSLRSWSWPSQVLGFVLAVALLGPPASGRAQLNKSSFFKRTVYYARILGWDAGLMSPSALASARTVNGAEFAIFRTNPNSKTHCPDNEVRSTDLLHKTTAFSIRTSGNMTKGTPKSSYKIKFTDKTARFLEMSAMNLKSMYNDGSQMHEALAWKLFADAKVPASRHTYAKFCINGRYYGLYSVIEEVDKAFLKERFGKRNDGNLYKANWADLGPATLAYRGAEGTAYFKSATLESRTYELKTNEGDKDPAQYKTYGDLARLISVLNGQTVNGDFGSDKYRKDVEAVFDVYPFLRWLAANVLLGAWDNYYRTPSNYHLYNGGPASDPTAFMSQPFFHWIPWDYDNCLGQKFDVTPWDKADIVKIEKGNPLPLATNLLRNATFLKYYLDSMSALLKNTFTVSAFQRNLTATWALISQSVYLESDSPGCNNNAPFPCAHTGRQFSNDEVYSHVVKQQQLQHGSLILVPILVHVKYRAESAKAQIKALLKR